MLQGTPFKRTPAQQCKTATNHPIDQGRNVSHDAGLRVAIQKCCHVSCNAATPTALPSKTARPACLALRDVQQSVIDESTLLARFLSEQPVMPSCRGRSNLNFVSNLNFKVRSTPVSRSPHSIADLCKDQRAALLA